METDRQLLERYVGQGSESAFRELIERHINVVYSAAVRESKGNASLAEDITQAVFTELARRTTKLIPHPTLSGWLYTCVRRMTANVRRAEERRQRREQEAFTMNELLSSDPTDNLWHQVRPVLDDVMHELNEEDRTLVVLRFFEGKSLKEIGVALGLTENAARMRVARSLERLRSLLAQRGVSSTASALAVVLTAGAAMKAPSALASAVATGALATAATASGPAALILAKLLGISKTQIAITGTLAVLVAGFVVWNRMHSSRAGTESTTRDQVALRDGSSTVAAHVTAREDLATAIPAPTNTPALSQMALHVVEAETGHPLAHAKLHLFYLLQDGRGETVKRATDENGKIAVDTVQRPFHGLNLFVTADGHVPKVISWGWGRSMPASYTMKLERGVTVSGIVVDEAGQAIDGATIEFDGPGNDHGSEDNIQFGPDTISLTDAEGRWSCNMIPKDFEQISLVITHPQYAEMTAPIRIHGAETNKSVITMSTGFTVTGTVQDSNGNAIEEAKVREVRLNEEGEHSKTTDASGAFEFKSMKAGELVLAVQAKGFAPAVQTLQITGALAGVRFELGAAQLLRGRIIDEDGNPIDHAWAETTRGRRKIQWSTTTDADGRFAWDSAPQEALLYSFQAEGFNRVYALELKADTSEHEIKLTREQPADTIQIIGTVADADTGEPLDSFKVLRSELQPDYAFPYEFGAMGEDGKFGLSFSSKAIKTDYQLQIEKEGYLPAVSRIFSRKEGNQTLAFKLQKGSGPSGVVLRPDGEPAVRATVLLSTPQAGVTLDGPAHIERGLNTTSRSTQTDEAGRFSLAPVSEPQGLIAIHDQGYAEVSMAAFDVAGHIMLQPWGRVEGRLVLDGQPVTDERIRAGSQVTRYDEAGRRFGFRSFHFEATTDSAGRFSFNKVPPGQCNIFRQTLRSHTGFESHEASVMVAAGSVTEVLLGGGGRPIIGKASLPGGTRAIDWQNVTVQLTLKTAHHPGTRPKRADFSSTQAYIEATDYFFETRRAQRRFGAFCKSDGSFRLQDIPAGTYELKIIVRGFKPDSVGANVFSGVMPDIASLLREVTVPEIPEGQSAEPLDLGILKLIAQQESAWAK